MPVKWENNGEVAKKIDAEGFDGIVEPLIRWYQGVARELPWRETTDPYRVWVSEIMLQQTRVETGIAYYRRFIDELPSVEALANVPDERLLKLWEGLGYYRRAINLKKAAGIVVEQHGGRLPDRVEELAGLPGIGPYTAGAIGSICFDRPEPAVDGNVVRVLSRLTAGDGQSFASPAAEQKYWRNRLKPAIPLERPGEFNQALMELGAMVCRPTGRPRCDQCPLADRCAAHAAGRETEFPGGRQAKAVRPIVSRTVLLIVCGGQVLLRRRPATGLLARLWEFPGIDGAADALAVAAALGLTGLTTGTIQPVEPVRHIFSHVEWRMQGWLIEGSMGELPPGYAFTSAADLEGEKPLPSAFRGFLSALAGKLA